MFEKLLFATDFSEYATKTLDCIAGFPGARDVILLHVIKEARSPRGGGEISESLSLNERNLLKEEKRYLETLGEDLRVKTVVKVSSDIAGAVLETAEGKGVSLIIVGARGNSLVARNPSRQCIDGHTLAISRATSPPAKHRKANCSPSRRSPKFSMWLPPPSTVAIADGFIAGEQITPGAPWQIRMSGELRARFVEQAPAGYLPMLEATKRLGVSRQTVLQRVKRGELQAVHVSRGRLKGLRIKVVSDEPDLLT